MGEEFRGVVCGGNRWNSFRNLFGSSPCSSSINDNCSFTGWSSGQQDPLTTSPSTNYAPLYQDLARSQPLAPSATIDHSWNQDLMYNNSGKSEPNYSQESAPALNPNMFFSDYLPTNQDFRLEQDSLNSASNGYTTSFLLQTLFDTDSQPHQLLTNQLSMKYSPVENCPMIHDFSHMVPKSSPNHLKFNDNTIPIHSSSSQFILSSIDNAKINTSNFTRKHHNEEAGKMGTVAKNAITEPALKRPRMETPSPLPTFKVRKEKLGDRVTALQQLVSPFGKTDTASVLHEAIECIKFLHDQVTVLSTPYLKKGSPPMQCQQATDQTKDQQEGPKQDLRSRGLCLVPITSTFPVATESPTDFWTSTFGGSFR